MFNGFGNSAFMDSAGRPIEVGDRVRFRGQEYTIKRFLPGEGRGGNIATIEFEEEQHVSEVADEWSVDLIQGRIEMEITKKDAGELYQLVSIAEMHSGVMVEKAKNMELGLEVKAQMAQWRSAQDKAAEWQKKLTAFVAEEA